MSGSWGRALWETLQTIVIALVLALLIRHFIVESFIVQGDSMEPTLHHSDRLLVNKFIYHFRPPAVGDIIVFRFPEDPSKDFIKRVVATADDTVELRDGRLLVNGKPVEDPYVRYRGGGDYSRHRVPKGTVFVLGDNRANSQDSRFFGPVPLQFIKGKTLAVWWPPSAARLFLTAEGTALAGSP